MKYRKLVKGDYSFGKGLGDFVSGAQAVSQAIQTRLLLLQGEWWESTEEGLPLFQNILGKPGTPENIQAIDLIIRDRIANTPDVIDIKNFQSSYENRKYSLRCIVETKYGEATVEVSF